MPSIAIVEDHVLLAETLRAALEQAGVTARVVPPAPLEDVLAGLRAVPCDLVLLDLDLGQFGDTTHMIAPLVGDGMRVLVLTGCADRMRIAAALEQGAIGYQQKGPGFAELLAQTRTALAAKVPFDAAERVLLLDELARDRRARARELAPFERLTEREAETLRELARGWSVVEIAARWFVSPATVRSHVRAVLAKLGVASQLAAVTAAFRVGWVDS